MSFGLEDPVDEWVTNGACPSSENESRNDANAALLGVTHEIIETMRGRVSV